MKKRLSFVAVLLALTAVFSVFVGCTDKDAETPLSVEMTIECLSLVETPAAVADNYKSLVPADGYILAKSSLKAKENETLYDFLNRIAQDKKLSVVSTDSSFGGGKYVSAIGNLSDTATTAEYWGGWTFTVNGETPKDGETWLSVDQVVLKDNDVVVFSYAIGLVGEY